MKILNKILIIALVLTALNSCSVFKKKDENNSEKVVKKKRINPNVMERAEEQKDSIFGKSIGGGSGAVYDFATSNVLWRASLEVVEFMPLQQVDYSGGIIITDWYSSINTEEKIKITFRFLSPELAPSSLKIISHKQICKASNNCSVTQLSEDFNSKIKNQVIEKARKIKILDEEKK